MRDRLPLALAGGVVLVGVLAASLIRGAERGSFADKLSTYRSEKDGSRALYLLATEGGLKVGRLQKSLDILEDGTQVVLLGTEFSEHASQVPGHRFRFVPDAGVDDDAPNPFRDDLPEDERLHSGMNALRAQPVEPEERERLMKHVKRGHTLVYVPWGHQSNPLLKSLDVRLFRAEKELEIRTLVPAQPTPYTLGVERIEARVQSFLDLPGEAVPLLVDDRLGQVVAAVVPFGQGRVVVLGAPELAMNGALERADNAQFWLSALRATQANGTVSFDEFHHGFSSERSIAEFAARYGLHFAVLQLVAGLALWAASLRRFGRPRPPEEDRRVGATDALYASSRLYREGKHHNYAASLVSRGLAQDLAPLAGRSIRADATEIAAGLASRDRKDLAAALTEVVALSRSATTDREIEALAGKAAAARALIRRHTSALRTAAAAQPVSRRTA